MLSLRRLSLGVALVAAMVPAAWAQEEPKAPADPIGEAIKVIEKQLATANAFQVDQARKDLVNMGRPAVPRVLAVLDSRDVAARVNAAIVLSNMAAAGDNSKELLTGVKRCAKDSNLAVAFWGFQGIMACGTTDERVAAVADCLQLSRPRPLRLVAAYTAMDRKLSEAAPHVIEHMKTILADYRAQVDAKLTIELTGAVTDVNPAMPERDMAGMGPKGGPAPAAAPKAGAGIGKTNVLRRKVEPYKLPAADQEQWAAQLEALPAVLEMHVMGLAAEVLTGEKFGFDATPPWDLDPCVIKAGAWKPAGAAPAAKPAEAPAPKPADKPAEKPAAKPADKAAPAVK